MTKKTSQKDLQKRVEQTIIKNGLIKPKDTVIVAVSGGADSVCLFGVLKLLSDKLDIKIKVCHYNHKLRGTESDEDERFVKDLSREWGVDCILGDRKKEACKSEDQARELRYKFFENILKKSRGAKIAIAHNSSDFIETLLMRLVRGTGLRGLKSIPLRRKKFIRPLLPFSRSEIIKFLKIQKLAYRTDKSNFDTKFLRNKIRHNLIPYLKRYNPKIEESLCRLISSSEIDYDFIENETDKIYKRIVKQNEKRALIKRDDFILLHDSIKYHLLNKVFSSLGVCSDISYKHIEDVLNMIEKNIGKKTLPLPHSLRVSLIGGKIVVIKG